jgi:hypothetical protein
MSRHPEYQRELDQLEQVWNLLDQWKAPEPPPDLAASFSARLDEQVAHSSTLGHRLLEKLDRPHRRWTLGHLGWNLAGMAMAASLAAGLFFIFSSGTSMPGHQSSPVLTAGATPSEKDNTVIIARSTPAREKQNTPRMNDLRPPLQKVARRLTDTGVFVEEKVEHMRHRRPEKDNVNFAIHNISSDVPEMNTKYYNTVFAMYEDPF